MRNTTLPCLLTLICLVGCGQRPEERENQSAASTAAVKTAQRVPQPATSSTPATAKIWFDPAALEACTPSVNQITTINWDASASPAKVVDVKVLGENGVETTFATSGIVGSKISGPWMIPGSIMIVRDHTTGVELGRAAVESKPCTR